MNQEQLGELLDRSYQQVQKYEGGKSRISLEIAVRISEIFSVSLDEMVRRVHAEYGNDAGSGTGSDADGRETAGEKEYRLEVLEESRLLGCFRKLKREKSRLRALALLENLVKYESELIDDLSESS